jgi:hypothetical protein
MTVRFRGQSYQRQCPVCHAALRWSILNNADNRIRAAANQHERGCPAAVMDPARLKDLTYEQAMAELTRLRESETDD